MSRNFELLQGAQGIIRRSSLPTATKTNRAGMSAEPRDTRPVDNELDFDLQQILQKLRNKWRWILLSTVAMTGLAALVCVLMPRQYKAESKIEILKQDAGGLSVGAANSAGADSDSLGFAMTLQTQEAVLKADTLSWQVIKELKLVDDKDLPADLTAQTTSTTQVSPVLTDSASDKRAADVLKKFKRNLTVDSISGTRLITVSYTDSDPREAARIVNQLVSDFVEYNFQVRYNATAKATDWLSQQLVDLKSQVEKSRERAVQLEKESGIFGEDEHHNIVLNRLEQLNNEVTAAEADRVVKEALYKLSLGGNPEAIADMLGTQSGSNSPQTANSVAVLNNLRQQEATLSAEYADASSKYGSAYPRLIQIKQRLDSVRSSISEELVKVVSRAKHQYELAKSREVAAKKSFTEQKAAAADMNDKAVNFLIAKNEADSNRDLYQHLLEKLKEAGVLAGLHSSELHIVDPARVPVRPSRPNVPLYLAVGGFAGMVLGVFSVFITDSMNNTMRDIGDIESTTYLPVLGVVPDAALLPVAEHSLKSALSNGCNGTHGDLIPGLRNPSVAEAFRAIRTSLLLSTPAKDPRVFIITSGMAREGKTFASINLAVALACNGSRVLLVDADLRRGMLSGMLNQRFGTGLSDLLLESDNNVDAFRQIDEVPGLTFLPAGSRPHGPAELLGSRKMTAMVDDWRRQFSYVLIDTPPILPVTDAVVLSPNVDAVILVVRFAVTTRQSLARIIRVLRDVQVNDLRVLVNGMDVRSSDYFRYAGSYGDDTYAGESELLIPPFSRSRYKEERA